ncbi:MAG: ABC transporter ATP-binding protein, partial [Eubacteriales bacterium]|nr:ABC transporter ATP-binding protein [Eubacteriales bacterium]
IIDRFSTASLITRSTTDVTNIQNAYQMLIRVAIRSPVMFAFSLFMAFSVNRSLSLVFIAVIPFLAGGLYLIIRHAHPIFKRVFKTYDRLNNVVQENLRGIRVVKAYVREGYEKKKFTSVSQEIFQDFTKAEKLLAFNGPLMQTSMYMIILMIAWFGAHLIVNDRMTTGQLVSLIAYAMQILMSLMMLAMVFVMITISRASAERVTEVLTEQSSLRNPAQPIFEVPDGSVDFQHVSFGYAGQEGNYCLKNINLHIDSGQVVGIIGGTGSAKSTLIQLIPRLYDAVEGQVSVGGIDVRDYDIKSLRDQVAVVLQKNVLFSRTIRENLRWGNQTASDEELIRVCKLVQAHDFIMAFPKGYDTYIEQGGSNVSGGQRQRICIARALLKQPKILILDDSTSAVDTRTEALIRQGLQSEIPNTTVFIVAQRINSVIDADQIIVMDDGVIDGIGDHETLLQTNAIYREVYDSQQNGGSINESA